MDRQQLTDLEAIKQLKAKYFLYLDTKEWKAWGTLFTDDVVIEGTRNNGSRADFLAGVEKSLTGVYTAHQGHTPIITFLDDRRARGVWAMFDELRFHDPKAHPWSEGYERRLGYGHYEEEYRKVGDEWKISFMRLARLFVWRENAGPLVQGGVKSAGKAWLEGR